eukprot:SAG11_NODE_30728_length_298_cov_0.778894_1_plen_77_part_01
MKESTISRLGMCARSREITYVLPLIWRPPIAHVVVLHQVGVLDGGVGLAAVHGFDAALDLYEGKWWRRNLTTPHALC